MIFDLKSGKRRRVVQIVFGFLAFIFFISFVGFGIGSEVSGGIFDALGISGGNTSSESNFDDQIEKAEERLADDPQDQRALLDLTNYKLLAATDSEDGVQTDEQTGLLSISEPVRAHLLEGLDAWDRYLKTDPKPVSAEGAVDALQINDLLFRSALGAGDASAALRAAEDGAVAAEIVAADRKTVTDYAALANYLYIAGRVDAGDAAAKRGLAVADESNREQFEQALRASEKRGTGLNEQLEKLIKKGNAEGAIEDPFGGLGGADPNLPPASSP